MNTETVQGFLDELVKAGHTKEFALGVASEMGMLKSASQTLQENNLVWESNKLHKKANRSSIESFEKLASALETESKECLTRFTKKAIDQGMSQEWVQGVFKGAEELGMEILEKKALGMPNLGLGKSIPNLLAPALTRTPPINMGVSSRLMGQGLDAGAIGKMNPLQADRMAANPSARFMPQQSPVFKPPFDPTPQLSNPDMMGKAAGLFSMLKTLPTLGEDATSAGKNVMNWAGRGTSAMHPKELPAPSFSPSTQPLSVLPPSHPLPVGIKPVNPMAAGMPKPSPLQIGGGPNFTMQGAGSLHTPPSPRAGSPPPNMAGQTSMSGMGATGPRPGQLQLRANNSDPNAYPSAAGPSQPPPPLPGQPGGNPISNGSQYSSPAGPQPGPGQQSFFQNFWNGMKAKPFSDRTGTWGDFMARGTGAVGDMKSNIVDAGSLAGAGMLPIPGALPVTAAALLAKRLGVGRLGAAAGAAGVAGAGALAGGGALMSHEISSPNSTWNNAMSMDSGKDPNGGFDNNGQPLMNNRNRVVPGMSNDFLGIAGGAILLPMLAQKTGIPPAILAVLGGVLGYKLLPMLMNKMKDPQGVGANREDFQHLGEPGFNGGQSNFNIQDLAPSMGNLVGH
jgi:hypothetical protein